MSLLKQLAGQTVIYGMSNILPRILHYVVFTWYITRRFPDQYDFGVYLEIYAYATIIMVLLTYRMETAFFRFGANKENREKAFGTAFFPLLFIVLLCVLFMYLNAQQIANLINHPQKPYYIEWFAMILGFDALVALPYAKMRLDNRPKRFLFFRLANIIITIVMVLFCLEILPLISGPDTFFQFDPAKGIDYVFLANLIASSSVFLLMTKEFLNLKFSFDFALWKKMIWYSMPLVIVGIAGNINQSFAAPIQKYFLGSDLDSNLTAAGIYGAPAKIALLLNLFIVAFNYAAEPFFFNNADKKDSKEVYGKVALAFTIVASGVLLIIAAYVDIFGYIIGQDYREALHIVPILLFANLFLGLYYNFSIWYKLNDRTYWGAIISVIGAIITLAISIYYLPKIGFISSAWAALACYGFMAIAGYLSGQKFYPIPYPIVKILGYVMASFVLVLLMFYLNDLGLNPILLFLIKAMLITSFLMMAWKKDGKKLLLN